ncbi:AMP-binding protein [Legionella londiniensis]|uniref:AMP-binding protein n=1 Tax=Legionella londiniensis TaxID=45068 RepID=A0A0W0VQM2_9GAMM|nr:AMP-binding protein [Legionella londiniensis]KTD22401.1 AMP-binding protein [Legionella londiniensis]STX93025.1 long-chain fatty-acid-CoA ligase [Legionella londiniensis]
MKSEEFTGSICHLLLEHEKKRASQIYLRQPREGQWHEYTWAEVMHKARQVAAFLKNSGLKKGTHIAIYSKNCAEWFIADFGISLANMVNVPLFPNQHEESIQYVLEHAEVKLVFVGKLDNHLASRRHIPDNIQTVDFDYYSDLETTFRWREIMQGEPLEEILLPEREDLYTIIYSSGTSGKPKGAMYTHEIIAKYLTLFPEDISRVARLAHHHLLSYLPLAHVYERSAIQLGSINISCDVSFVESLDAFAKNLREVKPTLFAAVPRIWDVFQNKIEQKLPPALLNILLKIPVVSGLIKNKIKHELGFERCKGFFSGASHLPVSILKFFDKLDIPIQEGYGQTENFAYATLSMLENRKPKYVGTPRLAVEIKKGEKDELLIKSPCLMKGYFKDKEATKEAFTEDGWLRTGDIVEIDEEQRVKILGRLSEKFKNLKGEFISPTPIEKKFAQNDFIENLCLVGRELSSNVLLVDLSKKARNMPKDEIKDYLQERLHQTNHDLKNYEKISHVLVVADEWTVENNILTPTLKVKRRVVEDRYHDFIQEAIEKHNAIIWE